MLDYGADANLLAPIVPDAPVTMPLVSKVRLKVTNPAGESTKVCVDSVRFKVLWALGFGQASLVDLDFSKWKRQF